MAQITADRHDVDDLDRLLESRRERIRSVVPTVVAVTLLFAVMLAGAHALRGLLDLGVWLVGSS